VEDERDGYGEMYWTDGSIYQGEWKVGIQHGYGKMTFPDGTVKEGYFENNVYVGPVQQPPEGFPIDGEAIAKKIMSNSKFL